MSGGAVFRRSSAAGRLVVHPDGQYDADHFAGDQVRAVHAFRGRVEGFGRFFAVARWAAGCEKPRQHWQVRRGYGQYRSEARLGKNLLFCGTKSTEGSWRSDAANASCIQSKGKPARSSRGGAVLAQGNDARCWVELAEDVVADPVPFGHEHLPIKVSSSAMRVRTGGATRCGAGHVSRKY